MNLYKRICLRTFIFNVDDSAVAGEANALGARGDHGVYVFSTNVLSAYIFNMSTYICICIHMYILIYSHINEHMYICIYTYICVHIYFYLCIYIYIHAFIHICINTFAYKFIYIYIHTYMYIYI